MAATSALNEEIFERVKTLPLKDKREVLHFIEYLRIREEQAFLDYVNMRTQSAKRAKQQGEHFTSLEELQQEYA